MPGQTDLSGQPDSGSTGTRITEPPDIQKEPHHMATFIKWTAITAAVLTGASFAYAAVLTARQRIDQGLQEADRMAEDARRVLASTEQTIAETQRTVRHLRATVAP